MNTAEIIAGEICGTVAFLGLAIGYPWLILHYAHLGVLKLARPSQSQPRKPKAETETSAAPAAGESPAGAAGPRPVEKRAA